MKLQDYLNYYMGCRVMAAPYGGQQKRLESGKLVGINVHDVAQVKLDNWQSVADVSITCIKPILRRLEDMTEGEMIGMLQATVPDDMDKEDRPSDDEYIVNMFYADGGNLVDERVAVGAEVTLRCFEGHVSIWKCGTIYMHDDAGEEQFRVNDPKAFHYLLQQHFDLFGLIDAGLAIDAKTVNP